MAFDYALARENMVQKQLRPWYVNNQRILAVFNTLQRERFVPAPLQHIAYADIEIPIAAQQMTLRPAVQARILQALDLQPDQSVLVVGTGTGLLTGYCSLLAGTVVSVEIHAELSTEARHALHSHGLIDRCQLILADVFNWRHDMRFDAICLCGAVSELPDDMLKWLHPQGRILVIHGNGPTKNVALLHRQGDARAPTMTSLFETNIPYLIGGEPASRFQF